MAGLGSYTRAIAAGQSTTIGARGTTVVVRDIAGGSGQVRVSTRANKLSGGDGVVYTLDMRRGEKLFTATEFDQVEVQNEAGVDVLVVMLIGYGDFVAPPINLGVSDFVTGLKVDVGNDGPQLLVAANPKRWRIHLQHDYGLGGNYDPAQYVLIGRNSAQVAAGEGLQLVPGAGFTLETTGELWAQSAVELTVPVRVLEEVFN